MSRDTRYQRLLNSPKWREVKRQVWNRADGECELCKREGRVVQGVDCHHIIPVESANPDIPGEMERLAYDVSNVMLLCVPCHIKVHTEALSHTKEKVAENKERRRRRFMEANDPNWRPDESTD